MKVVWAAYEFTSVIWEFALIQRFSSAFELCPWCEWVAVSPWSYSAHTFVMFVISQLFDKSAISQSCKSADSDRVINVTMVMKRICMQTGHSGNVTSIFALCRFVWKIIIATHVLLSCQQKWWLLWANASAKLNRTIRRLQKHFVTLLMRPIF